MEVTNDNQPNDPKGLQPNPTIVGADQSPSGPAQSTAPDASVAAKPKFPEPEVLVATVNPNEKPKEGPTPFSFTTPKAIQKDMTQPTKGDAARAQEPAKPKLTLAQLDAEIASEEKNKEQYTIDDYRDTAEMFVEGWEALLTFAARMISKDSSESTYEFTTGKKERLIHQATKVSRKRNWVMPIEYLFIGTLLPASGTILLRAQDNRKKYFNEHPEQGKENSTDSKNPSKKPPGRPPGRPRK